MPQSESFLKPPRFLRTVKVKVRTKMRQVKALDHDRCARPQVGIDLLNLRPVLPQRTASSIKHMGQHLFLFIHELLRVHNLLISLSGLDHGERREAGKPCMPSQ